MTLDIAQATPETFQPFVGERFAVAAPQGALTLTLDNVKLFPGSMIRDARVVVDGVELPPRAAFALTFEGPREPVVEPGTYEISHPGTGPMHLLLSPFRQDMDCTLYECVFN